MEALAGPVWIAAIVLALAGVGKLLDPAPTRGALREMGLPWRGAVVPALAVAEIATGLAVVLTGAAPALAVLAAWYVGFTAFVVVALRRAVPLASCGCLGKADTPPTVAHLVVDGLFAVVALVAMVAPPGSIDAVLADQTAAGVPLLLWVGVGVYVTYLVLAVLPLTLVAAQPVPARTAVGRHR